ncbi:MAG: potassium-transporting ATPase subunit KdpC [Pseudomonadota bacterium]
MFALVRPALVSMGLFTLILGVAYPLAVTGIAQAVLPDQAGGSLIRREGQVVGSALIGQSFAQPGYLHGRPSAAGSDGYDAAASSGSNLGPLNDDLIARVKAGADELRAEAGGRTIPADAVTTSGSGLDPDISPAYAELQAQRVAQARGVPVERVQAVIRSHVRERTLGVLGQPRVNVLETNLALDEALGRRQPPPR